MSSQPPAAERLPRGRHKLSREQVVASQRERMLWAMAEALAEKGYTKTAVADVLSRAGVSRETFYEQFGSKEECFLETLDHASRILLARIVASADEDPQGRPPPLADILGAYLEAVAAEPAYARVYLVDTYAAGPRAVERRVAAQEMLANALAERLGARNKRQRQACELLVAAVGAMTTNQVALGRTDELPRLRRPLTQMAQPLMDAAFPDS